MRVFIAGGTGAVGKRLVPLLVAAGHDVVATTTSPAKTAALERRGAEPVVLDILDRDPVAAALGAAEPEAVVHQASALSGMSNFRKFAEEFAATDRLRTEGTDNLLAGAALAGARRVVVQSYTGWPYARAGGPVKTEEDPLDPDPPEAARGALAAIRHLERRVVEAEGLEGVALRYGSFYGPGTGFTEGGILFDAVRKRKFPLVGGGTGIWSFVHMDDVASATKAAIEGSATGVFNVVDDEPAPVSEWLPHLAAAIGAKSPRRVPGWVGRIVLGEFGLGMMTTVRGASNEKAKRELGWSPRYPSWRLGFETGLVDRSPSGQPVAE